VARLILDSGAVIAFARGNPKVAAFLRLARQRDEDIVLPAVVIAETVRDGATDARINQLIAGAYVSFVGLHIARLAGRLQARAQLTAAIDALVVAEALRSRRSCVLLTSDPDDLRRLAGDAPALTIIAV
jgi:predicted nucleic acid-binding protein